MKTTEHFYNTEQKAIHYLPMLLRPYAKVFSPSHVFQETVLRSNSRVVQSVRDNPKP